MKDKRFYLLICIVFILGVLLRVVFSPPINFETDSFSVLLSAENIAQTGRYLVPPVRLTDSNGYQSFLGWAVGCPLFLAVFFKLLGYSEALARFLMILLSSAVIPIVAFVGDRLYGKRLGIITGFLLAVNPFLVCINSRILTVNFGFSYFVISISLLLLSVLRPGKADFMSAQDILDSRKSFMLFLGSFLFLGFTLGTRDDYAMFVFAFLIILAFVVKASYSNLEENRGWNFIKLFSLASVLTIIGYFPNIYFNFVNYGRFFTSSHYEYGGRLSLQYFLRGANSSLGLPGWVVILLAVLVYSFPVISIFFLNLRNKINLLVAALIFSIILPVVFIGGAYFTASTGGAPRYIMPVIPFALLSAGIVFLSAKYILRPVRIFFLICLILWNVILFYPPVLLFKVYPKLVYLTQYSPWYNISNFLNYPHPVKSMLAWVIDKTNAKAVILSDYDSYHYFFYAKRDVADRENITEIKKLLASRQVFFIEDHQTLKSPGSFDNWVKELNNNSIVLAQRYSLPLFSPVKACSELKVYELVRK